MSEATGRAGRRVVRRGFAGLLAVALLAVPRPSAAGGGKVPGRSDRVARAKKLLREGAAYPKGCSDFVSAVLMRPWEDANTLMGQDPTYVGVDNVYKGLTPGEVVGWRKEGGSGHVAIYVGESGMRFIDVRSDGGKPRAVKKGYGSQKLYKSKRF